jgi:hypothetical protein
MSSAYETLAKEPAIRRAAIAKIFFMLLSLGGWGDERI